MVRYLYLRLQSGITYLDFLDIIVMLLLIAGLLVLVIEFSFSAASLGKEDIKTYSKGMIRSAVLSFVCTGYWGSIAIALAINALILKYYHRATNTNVAKNWVNKGYHRTVTPTTLEKFKALYYTAPYKYSLNVFPNYKEKLGFTFPFIDWIKYLIWADKIKEESKSKKESEKHNKIMDEALNEILQDIEEVRKQGEDCIKEAKRTTYAVAANWLSERRGD